MKAKGSSGKEREELPRCLAGDGFEFPNAVVQSLDMTLGDLVF